MSVPVLALGLCLLALGQEPVPGPPTTQASDEAPSPPLPGFPPLRETVVVTSNRSRTSLIDSPAAVSVISSEAIAVAPDRSFGELLRAVPGVNAARGSIRDYEITSRQATSTLANSQP